MDAQLCNYCLKPAELCCQRCRDPYCSKDCQNVDWPQHKLFCFPMPLLVKPLPKPHIDNNQATSPPPKFQILKLTQECDENSKNGDSNSQLLQSIERGNIPKPIDSVKINNTLSTNVDSIDRNFTNEKLPEVKNSIKPPYYKTVNVDVASIRKPGTLSQVIPKVAPKEIIAEQPNPKKVEPSKPSYVQPPKQEKAEPLKQLNAQLPKQEKFEPPKQLDVQLSKLENVEPLKQLNVQLPKQEKVEPPKQLDVQLPKQEKAEPPKQLDVQLPKQEKAGPRKIMKTMEAVRIPNKIETQPPAAAELKEPKIEVIKPLRQRNSSGAWMKWTSIVENKFVGVVIQYIDSDSTAWVSLVQEDDENNNLLRLINRNISTTSTPNPDEVVVNALFLVPFEDIYYRGVVLEPVSANGTVSVRLVDFGNTIALPIGELKSPLPAVMEMKAFAFPIKLQNPRDVEIGNCIKIKKESIDNNGIMTVVVEGDAPAPPMTTITTMKDIDVAPIPTGSNVNLICLDFSNIALGYISGCIADSKAVQFVEGMGPTMSKHCAKTTDEYSPRVDELCLAQFEDGEWYRAVTVKVIDDDNFEIMFIDYGNIITVKRSAIRKMIDDFLHPCMMNKCFIKSFPAAPTKEEIHKAALYFNDHPAFNADVVEKDGDKYVIHVTI